MKKILIAVGILIFLSCDVSKNELIPHFHERELSFLHLRHGYDKSNKWIKNPDNILMLHETFKKIGYKNLVSDEEWNSGSMWGLDIWKRPVNFVDSLILTFNNSQAPTYYQEFWGRRKSEGNGNVVYSVIQEIQQIMSGKEVKNFDPKMVNDTLERLIRFEYPNRHIGNTEANKHVEFLIQIGLHASAYNLVSFEHVSQNFKDVKWDRKEEGLIKTLKKSDSYQRPWFEDNTK